MIVESSDVAIGTTTGAAAAQAKFNPGYDVDGIIGYDFGGFRLESEVGFKRTSVDSWTSATTSGVNNTFGVLTPSPAGTYDTAGGALTSLSFMLNGLLDFGSDEGFSGYVGGGAGVARIKENFGLNKNGVSFVRDSDTGFAWQAIAGIRYPVTSHIDAGLKYRYFNANNVNLTDSLGRSFDTKMRDRKSVV